LDLGYFHNKNEDSGGDWETLEQCGVLIDVEGTADVWRQDHVITLEASQ
jgi:tryptophan 2,3-dioxygenase